MLLKLRPPSREGPHGHWSRVHKSLSTKPRKEQVYMTKSNDMHPICEQFKRLYNDNVWLRKTLYNLPIDLASKRICESVHSCVAIVVHIDKWRRLTIDQLLGKEVELPCDNFFSEFTVKSRGEYDSLIDSFFSSESIAIETIYGITNEKHFANDPYGNRTKYATILGMYEHDSYHFGQVRVISKFLDRQ